VQPAARLTDHVLLVVPALQLFREPLDALALLGLRLLEPVDLRLLGEVHPHRVRVRERQREQDDDERGGPRRDAPGHPRCPDPPRRAGLAAQPTVAGVRGAGLVHGEMAAPRRPG
jgi:hypothetical protein